MAADTSSLATKLVELVVPNYPFLQHTSISVLDVHECARRGTAEQRRTGRDVREVLEEVWALEDGHPLRKSMEVYLAHESGSKAAMAAGAGERAVARMPRVTERGLPTELVHKVLDSFVAAIGPPDHQLRLVALGRLRLISRSIGSYAQQKHAQLFQRYTNRVTARLLHLVGPGSTNFASVVYPYATLFGSVSSLDLFLRGDEIDRVNTLLPLFASLATLTVCVESERMALCRLGIAALQNLRELRVRTGNVYDGVTSDIQLGETRTRKQEQALADCLAEEHNSHYFRPQPSLRRLDLEDVDVSEIPAACLANLARAHIKEMNLAASQVTLADLVALQLTPVSCWKMLRAINFDSGCIDDDLVNALGLGTTQSLQELDLSQSSVSEPSALALASNRSITQLRLAYNFLESGALGLRLNTTLRKLDCRSCMAEGVSIAAFLRELGAELKDNKALEDLWLANNEITDDDLAAFDMEGNTSLRRLSFAGNYALTADGVMALRLSETTAVSVLYLRDTDVTEEFARHASTDAFHVTLDGHPDWAWARDEA